MRVPVVLSCLALASASVLVAGPASAAPTPPACGSTLTVDTVLRADLVCAGPGLVLGPDVSLDLHGHTLRGTAGGVGLAVTSTGEATVRNGTITGWDTAVRTLVDWDGPGSGPLHVDRLAVDGNGTGIDGTGDGGIGAKSVTVTRSTFTNNHVLALSAQSITVDLDHTMFADNAVGYWGDTGSSASVTDVRFVRNDRALIVTEGSATVDRSTFVDNPAAVSSGGMISGLELTNSRITGSDLAVDGIAAVSRISGSTFVGNTTAVQVGQWGATITANTFRANQTTVSFAVAPAESDGGSVVQDNTFRLNGDGLRLENADAAVSIGGNDARNNTGWGIYAPGATDLGGNTARHNGNEPQCVGVVCP
ncbi:hypothetical protein [Cellulomonas sp. URHB0016]